MKNIYASSSSGVDGVEAAICLWWLSKNDIKENIEMLASNVAPYSVQSLRDEDLGVLVIESNHLEDDFEADVEESPEIKFIADLVKFDKTRFKHCVSAIIGQALKRSEWMVKNAEEIRKVRRQLKDVEKVMGS